MVTIVNFPSPLPNNKKLFFGQEFNVIVKNEFVVGDEADLFFGGERIFTIPPTFDMFELLVACGVFSSKGQARKNWKLSGKDIPDGFSDFINVGKQKVRITILNPNKHNKE